MNRKRATPTMRFARTTTPLGEYLSASRPQTRTRGSASSSSANTSVLADSRVASIRHIFQLTIKTSPPELPHPAIDEACSFGTLSTSLSTKACPAFRKTRKDIPSPEVRRKATKFRISKGGEAVPSFLASLEEGISNRASAWLLPVLECF